MNVYLRLLRSLRPYRGRLVLAVVVTALYALLEGASIGMISPLTRALITRVGDTGIESTEMAAPAAVSPVEEVLPQAARALDDLRRLTIERFEGYLFPEDPMTALTRVSLVILIVFLLKAAAAYARTITVAIIEQAVMRDLRDQLFDHLTGLSLDYFHRRRLGELLSRVTHDVNLVRAAVTAVLFVGVRDSFLIVVMLFWVFWVSPQLALVSIVVIPPSTLLIAGLGRRLRRSSRRTQERMADLTAILHEALSGMRVVKAFAMERFERERFARASQEVYSSTIRMKRYWALSSPSSEILGAVAAVAVVFFGGRLILVEGTLTPDRFFLFLVAMVSMIRPIKSLFSVNAELQQGVAAAERIFSVLDQDPGVCERRDARPVTSLDREIRFEQVSFSYDPGEPVLTGIDLTIAAGEVVALVGPSGAGKSTLADLLPRFADPTAGRVTLDGQDLRDLRLGDLRRLIGVVTQEVILFNDTVRWNVAYGDGSVSRERLRDALVAAHADEFVDELPLGVDTPIGDRGVRLSGGQRQRLAIARAIFKNPPILVFDEATSALDTRSERLVQEAIARLLRGRTVLVIAHRLSTIQAADRIVVLDTGRIVEEGRHQELLAAGGVYARLYRLEKTTGSPLPVSGGAA